MDISQLFSSRGTSLVFRLETDLAQGLLRLLWCGVILTIHVGDRIDSLFFDNSRCVFLDSDGLPKVIIVDVPKFCEPYYTGWLLDLLNLLFAWHCAPFVEILKLSVSHNPLFVVSDSLVLLHFGHI